MKTTFRLMIAASLLFSIVSCSKDETTSVTSDKELNVTFTTSLADLGTRAEYGDGQTVDVVYLAVYEPNGTTPLASSRIDGTTVTAGKATIDVVLLKDKTYDLVFWAQKNGTDAYELEWDNRQIVVNYGEAANDEERDAFFLVRNGYQAGHHETSFTLNRPFAQINVGNSDADKANVENNGVVAIESSALTIATKVKNTLNLNDGSLGGDDVDVTFTSADIPAGKIAGTEFNYLSMNYLLVNDEQLVDLEYTFVDDKDTSYARNYYSVPVQRNYRTNIVGQIISSPYEFNVTIDPIFGGDNVFPETELERVATFGGEISLTENVVLNSPLRVQANMTLNLNGFNLTTASGNAIINSATLKVIGEGTISSGSTYGIRNNGSLVVDGPTVNAIYNAGELLFKNGAIENTLSGRHGIYHRGTKITIENGQFSSTSGNELINALADSNVTINGGTFTQIGKSYLFGEANAGITINGGTFNGYVNADNTNDKMRPGAAVVAGGSFNFDPTAWLAAGYVAVDNGNGTWTVAKEITTSNVSEVFANLSTTAPTTIVVSEPIDTTDQQLSIPEGAEVTLVLDDTNTISGNISKANGNVLVNNGTLTIKGGTINSTDTSGSGGSAIRNNGVMVVEDATINGAPGVNTGVWPSYAFNNYGTLTLKNTTITGHHGVLSCGAPGTTIVDNCTFERVSGLDVSSHLFYIYHSEANVIVNSGTFKYNNGYDGSLAYIISGQMTINGGDWLIESKNAYGPAVLTNGKLYINGGYFLCGLLDWGGEIEVSGGKFYSSKVSQTVMANYLVSGKSIVDNGDGTYNVQ